MNLRPRITTSTRKVSRVMSDTRKRKIRPAPSQACEDEKISINSYPFGLMQLVGDSFTFNCVTSILLLSLVRDAAWRGDTFAPGIP